MSAENISAAIWTQLGTAIVIILGIIGVISYFERKMVAVKQDICDDLEELRNDMAEIRAELRTISEKGEELLAKLNEHLVLASQATATLESLKDRIRSHDEELDSLHRSRS